MMAVKGFRLMSYSPKNDKKFEILNFSIKKCMLFSGIYLTSVRSEMTKLLPSAHRLYSVKYKISQFLYLTKDEVVIFFLVTSRINILKLSLQKKVFFLKKALLSAK